MFRYARLAATAATLVCAAGAATLHADRRSVTLAVTMTNDTTANAVNVYDAATGALVQTLPTQGKGGVAGNARGVKNDNGRLVAVVNNGSGTVALFKRVGDRLSFDRLVTTTSAPVSVDFGNDHMYVAGASTVDSFQMHGDDVVWRDGSASLELAGGGVPPAGSTAQVGVDGARTLLVTLKTDPTPGTVDVVRLLEDGAVEGSAPTAVSAPDGTLTPFGFAVYPDGTAVITLAHSSQDGLFRNGAFASVINAGQAAPCWMTRAGKYVFTANTGSKTISRLVGTSANVFVDVPVAANIATGGAPADIDTAAGTLGVIDHTATESHLSLFSYDRLGELTVTSAPINVGVANANGIAIVPDRDGRQRD